MDDWQSRNSAPAFDGSPMALDRYEEAYQREADRSAASWCEKFDQELFPEGLEQFLASLSIFLRSGHDSRAADRYCSGHSPDHGDR